MSKIKRLNLIAQKGNTEEGILIRTFSLHVMEMTGFHLQYHYKILCKLTPPHFKSVKFILPCCGENEE